MAIPKSKWLQLTKMHTTLTDDLKFLISCCQTTSSQVDEVFIKNYLLHATKSQMTTLLEKANHHAILPLVYKTLATIPDTPPLFLSSLKKHYMYIVKKNMRMTAELLRIMELLEDHGIEALAFKGPVLSQLAYGDITLRQYVDLDILIEEKDALKTAKLMSENDHSTILALTFLSSQTCLNTAKDFSLMSKVGVHTELHWRLFEKKYNISLLSCISEQKCQSVKINGKNIPTLQNELLLVYLCLHGAKHAFERIEWICDVDRLIRHTNIHWHEALLLAQKSHSTRAFYLSCSLAHSLFNTPLPKQLDTHISFHVIQNLEKMTLQKLSEKKEAKGDFKRNKETFFYQAKLFDRKKELIVFCLSTFFKVSTSDCQTYVLPEKLKFLYVFLRPLRLMFSYMRLRVFPASQN